MSIKKILIANRGEIAVRIIETCRRLGIRTVAVYSDADRYSKAVNMADEAVYLGGVSLSDSYLNAQKIIQAARDCDADAIHPGYGFLSEQADFAEQVDQAGLIFIGAPAEAMRLMGSKSAAKQTMLAAGVPCVPGYQDDNQDADLLLKEAINIGFPVLIKAVSGGGGKGMKIVEHADDFEKQLSSAQREARNAFGDDRVILEKYITRPKHIEVQVFADSQGQVVHLYERDCSTQRRYQKIIEEAPAAGLGDELRQAMQQAAVKATQAIDYRGAGTIEFILDDDQHFYFMEMNTRLQVEHRVTEMVTGVDLVAWQIAVAEGKPLPLSQAEIHCEGHAIQVRVYAEDTANDYLPSTGLIEELQLSTDAYGLVDSGVRSQDTVSIHYDPMIAKLVAWGVDRSQCIARMQSMLNHSVVFGVTTNLAFLSAIIDSEVFREHQIYTNSLDNKAINLQQAIPPEVMAILADDLLKQNSHASIWQKAAGWRLQGTQSLTMTMITADLSRTFQVEKNNEGYLVNGQHHYQPTQNDYCYRHRHHVQVIHHNQRYTFQLPNHDVQAVASDANAMYAPMPGKIIAIKVAEGEQVVQGDTLLIMEAMKMELAIKAERDGEIKSLAVVVDEQVKADDVLVELVP
ncbi:acetyl/propionyl/methylcrotonyl-CoA carboxylase subunit alpha [Marinicella sp. S6413]|uniref:acetyl/propionyl/methylcrotonyl-CoA carboxylase subunit alpha n=1 Tax=Marinicella gelatinilytica TaxID=2996017 RepID=UPI0022609BE7|nr:acetyl/propionyl/methylcrotonyl-CoA carboxylase subunit alpha [Marinicella gelatinilytica]MCX7544619.1 acetyl/propionyl/methylcrotonyl-CoA carboxylase subunit alpha [Marinicella gelatinilytica]